MTSNIVMVHGVGGKRLVRELIGVLDHRGVDLTCINATLDGDSCRINVAFDTPNEARVELLVKRINRVVGVVKTMRLDAADGHQRSTTVVTVKADGPDARTHVLALARAFGAVVLEVDARFVTLSFVDTPAREGEFLNLLAEFGVYEIARTGPIGVRRSRRGAGRVPATPLRTVPA